MIRTLRYTLGTLVAVAALLLPGAAVSAAPELTCPSGYLCAWPDTSGIGERCAWSGSSRDWTLDCSWSGTSPARMIENAAISGAIDGACLYRGANYQSPMLFVPRGMTVISPAGLTVRSHRWVTSDGC